MRLGGMLASTPCGITQASSPTVMGARSSSSCESRCVAPSAGTGHPLLHRVGGRRPPSLSLVLKCEREPGTPVIPVSKRRAKGGPLHRAEQCGANHAGSGPCVQDRHSGRSSLVGKRWVGSARPRRERAHHQYRRECAPVSVGPARRRDKGRDWSFEIHWRGAPKRLLKRHLAGWASPRRTLDDGLFSSRPSQRPGDGGAHGYLPSRSTLHLRQRRRLSRSS